MPTGIPNVPQMLATMQTKTQLAFEYLEIPSYELSKELFLIAYNDIIKALSSTYSFALITSRPLIRIISLVSRYVFAAFKVIAQCTMSHLIVGLKEAYQQFIFASKWFIEYQKSLPPTAVYLEIAAIGFLIGAYALRRYIRKKRYVERVQTYCKRKKDKVLMKYNLFVDRVAQTSMFVALLLPHVLYILFVSLMKLSLPKVLSYFAYKIPIPVADVISFYYPMLRTVLVLHEWQSFGFQNAQNKSSGGETSQSENSSGGMLSLFRRTRKVSEYEKTIEKHSSKEIGKKSTSITRTRLSDRQKVLVETASELLLYWIVYAIICTVTKTMLMLPILSRIFSNYSTKTPKVSSLPWKQKKLSFFGRIKPTYEFLQEIRLIFFIWLCFLPTSLTSIRGNDTKDNTSDKANNSIKDKILSFEKKSASSRKQIKVPSNRPVDIIYMRMAPTIAQLISSSSHLFSDTTDEKERRNGIAKSYIASAIAWCSKVLDLMVWTKMISEKTKSWIISTLVDCTDLMPALLTIFMPSYFTNYGCIYAQYLVPSAASSQSYEQIRKKYLTNTEKVEIMFTLTKYLKYWIIQGLVSSLLSAFTPILVWIPLSTHVTLLLWAYIQNESVTLQFYDALECDLVAFGLLHRHDRHEAIDVNDTVTMKVFQSIKSRVPSNLSGHSSTSSLKNITKQENNDKPQNDEVDTGNEPTDEMKVETKAIAHNKNTESDLEPHEGQVNNDNQRDNVKDEKVISDSEMENAHPITALDKKNQ